MGYIDDIGILAVRKDMEEISELLAKAYINVCKTLSWSYGSKFDLDKHQLVHFTKQTSINITHLVRLSLGHTINAEKHVKYLGLWLDKKLQWGKQVKKVKHKVEKSIGALASLRESTWGMSFYTIRKIYLTVVILQISYGCLV